MLWFYDSLEEFGRDEINIMKCSPLDFSSIFAINKSQWRSGWLEPVTKGIWKRTMQGHILFPQIQTVRKWWCDLVCLSLALISNYSFHLSSQILYDVPLIITFPIKTFVAFQLQSLGTFPLYANKTITAAITLVTATGGLVKAFSSVRLTWKKISGTDTELCDSSRFVPQKLSDYKYTTLSSLKTITNYFMWWIYSRSHSRFPCSAILCATWPSRVTGSVMPGQVQQLPTCCFGACCPEKMEIWLCLAAWHGNDHLVTLNYLNYKQFFFADIKLYDLYLIKRV